MIFRPIVLAALLIPSTAFAETVMVVDAWMPPSPPAAMSHAAYVTLHNQGGTPRVLTGGAADGYTMTHLHHSAETAGVATMTMIHQIEIPAGGMLLMKPGGLHVMLMGPDAPVSEGDVVPLSLTFANGDVMSIDAEVKPRDFES
jgi:copper(I)-binding protein